MKTWHVSTFCRVRDVEVLDGNVMPLVEVVLVVNMAASPSEQTIEFLLGWLTQGLVPLLSEVNEIPYVPNLNGQ